MCLLILFLSGCSNTDSKNKDNEHRDIQNISENKDSLLEESGKDCLLDDKDRFGKINDVCITTGNNSYADTFGKLNFDYDYSIADSENNMTCVINYVRSEIYKSEDFYYPDFNDGTKLSLWNDNNTAEWTDEDIAVNGYTGYDIDCWDVLYEDRLPDISWAKDITWGALTEDIKAVYGIPTSVVDHLNSGYVTYEYAFTDGSLKTNLSFAIDVEEKQGLTEVRMSSYKTDDKEDIDTPVIENDKDGSYLQKVIANNINVKNYEDNSNDSWTKDGRKYFVHKDKSLFEKPYDINITIDGNKLLLAQPLQASVDEGIGGDFDLEKPTDFEKLRVHGTNDTEVLITTSGNNHTIPLADNIIISMECECMNDEEITPDVACGCFDTFSRGVELNGSYVMDVEGLIAALGEPYCFNYDENFNMVGFCWRDNSSKTEISLDFVGDVGSIVITDYLIAE